MILDERIGREMVTSFMNDLHDAEEITLERFRQRSWLERPVGVCGEISHPLVMIPEAPTALAA